MIHKKTLRHKKNKYNRRRRTSKLYKGGNVESNDNRRKNRSGIFGIIGEKISGVGENAMGYVTNKGARFLGYKPIEESDNVAKEDEPSTELPSIPLPDVLGQATTIVLDNVNEVLKSPEMVKNIERAAEETKEITEDLVEKINEKFDDPEFEKKIADATENLADVANIVIDSADEPINKVIDKTGESFYKLGSVAATNTVKIASDVLATLPGIGVIFDLGRLVNDGSKAVVAVSEAGSDFIQATSDVVGETSKKLSDSFKEKKKEKEEVENRIANSSNEFNMPMQSDVQQQKGGNKKTRKFLKRRKMKSKRVRFHV
jgi:hypothetical protein